MKLLCTSEGNATNPDAPARRWWHSVDTAVAHTAIPLSAHELRVGYHLKVSSFVAATDTPLVLNDISTRTSSLLTTYQINGDQTHKYLLIWTECSAVTAIESITSRQTARSIMADCKTTGILYDRIRLHSVVIVKCEKCPYRDS
ncbi:hypothetical protein EVAR_42530_1 [Eumeta japonica]|uniref:Uncharacterized protein n=1 Tax=Eumeta variegata TaxID=151549 RepID=A0A4C1WTA6_EUMVA|nr:hypothetical protein EVAR_42530_1 [Eumeta japonica]